MNALLFSEMQRQLVNRIYAKISCAKCNRWQLNIQNITYILRNACCSGLKNKEKVNYSQTKPEDTITQKQPRGMKEMRT